MSNFPRAFPKELTLLCFNNADVLGALGQMILSRPNLPANTVYCILAHLACQNSFIVRAQQHLRMRTIPRSSDRARSLVRHERKRELKSAFGQCSVVRTVTMQCLGDACRHHFDAINERSSTIVSTVRQDGRGIGRLKARNRVRSPSIMGRYVQTWSHMQTPELWMLFRHIACQVASLLFLARCA